MKTESRTDTTTQISLKDIRDYIAKNHHQPLTIEHLALISGLSSSYFGEAFKKAFDQSATDYLTALRIGHAKQLSNRTSPSNFVINPIIIRISVVFPAPLGPTNPITSPFGTEKETLLITLLFR